MLAVREYAWRAMAAYAVMARIGRVDPHLTVYDVQRDTDRDGGGWPGATSDMVDDVAAVESDLASDPGPSA